MYLCIIYSNMFFPQLNGNVKRMSLRFVVAKRDTAGHFIRNTIYRYRKRKIIEINHIRMCDGAPDGRRNNSCFRFSVNDFTVSPQCTHNASLTFYSYTLSIFVFGLLCNTTLCSADTIYVFVVVGCFFLLAVFRLVFTFMGF